MMTNSNKKFKVYRASAGSGKTFTLVKEYLLQCLVSNKYKTILGVTFTNKAANELKERVIKYLLNIINGKHDGMSDFLLKELNISFEELQTRASTLFSNILHDYSNLNISTIDAFVQRISRAFARDLGLPSGYNVIIDNDDLTTALLQLIDDEIGPGNSFLTDILKEFIINKISEEESVNITQIIADYIVKLLSEEAYAHQDSNTLSEKEIYDANQKAFHDKIENNKHIFEQHREKLLNDFNKFNSIHGINENNYSRKTLPKAMSKLANNENNPFTDSANRMMLGESSPFNKNANQDTWNSEFEKLITPTYHLYREADSNLRILVYIQKQLYVFSLRNYITELTNTYISESNKVHISEFNKRISENLGDCIAPYIYERSGERYEHYFIDEFQDTSLLQWRNFLPLIDNSLSENHLNIVVGDAKQAIYRFRSGEVEQIIQLPKIYNNPHTIFSDSCEQKLNNEFEPQILDTNWRSYDNIIKFNNAFFKYCKCFLNAEYQTVYNDVRQKTSNKPGGFVQIEVFDKHNDQIYLDRCKTLVEEIIEKGFQYNDIIILVRNNTKGNAIAKHLHEQNIPVISQESILLQFSNRVMLIISSLYYLQTPDNPLNQANLLYYRALTSGNTDLTTVFNQSTDTQTEISILLGLEQNALQNCMNRSSSLYDLCEALIRLYRFDSLNDAYLLFFLECVQGYQTGRNIGLADFLDYWEKKKDKLSVQFPDDMNAVKVMSIHKSKGLESKIIIYPFAMKSISGSRITNSEIWIHKNDLPIVADIENLTNILFKLNRTLCADTPLEKLLDLECQKTALDNINLLYVALTRAQQQLYILSDGNENQLFNDFFSKNPSDKDDKLKFSTEEFEDNDSELSFNVKRYIIGNAVPVNNTAAHTQTATYDSINSIDWMTKISISTQSKKQNLSKAQSRGLLIHEILSKIQTDKDIDSVLKEYESKGEITHDEIDDLAQKIKTITQLPSIAEAYQDDAIIRNEMDFIDNQLQKIRPDRFAELKSSIVLIDYKTGAHNDKYFRQLKTYKTALQGITTKKIKSFLVYIGDDVEVIAAD